MRDSVSGLHPAISFLFFVFVLLVTLLMLHPAFLLCSFLAAAVYLWYLKGFLHLLRQLAYLLPLMLFACLLNTLFNHQGVTTLFYLPNGNPITLEATLYGLASAATVCSVILWFGCYHCVITSDKFLYLFGRIIPALALLLSMALRFVPRFQTHMRRVITAQRAIGHDLAQGKRIQRIRYGGRILSITLTWALENGIVTADSMKSRGYGSCRRTHFSLYRFDRRDAIMLGGMLVLMALVCVGISGNFLSIRYYPSILLNPVTVWSVLSVLAFGLFCFLPILLNGKEALAWRRLQSKI